MSYLQDPDWLDNADIKIYIDGIEINTDEEEEEEDDDYDESE